MNSSSADSDPRASARSIWVFTPSRTAPEDLEAILVQRHELLKDTVERIRESALTANKHHLLFVGPRGSGKTHLATLIVSRISADAEAAQKLRLAWLNEDETCTSLLELLIKIYIALEKRYPGEFRTEDLSEVYDHKATAALELVKTRLLASLGSRTLVMVAENLDALFESMGDQGQKQFRSFIQEHPRFAIVGTAQKLVEDLSNRAKPFFGFFQTEHLKPLSVEQAATLLQNIATVQGKTEVSTFLSTSRGRSRVRALHHLSGGNHRIYIVLSQFITQESLDTLIGPFLKMVDELTPYYQERVRWLPPLQRKIVELLCTSEGTVPVKEIARKLFSSPQTISSQLQDLREKGYVESNQRGRESLYEVSEPLMRICVEVKENQNAQPLRLLVDFLRVWYDDVELQQRLGKCQPESHSHHYLTAALARNSAEGNLRMKMLVREIMGDRAEEFDTMFLKRLETVVPEELFIAVQCQMDGDGKGALVHIDEALSSAPSVAERANIMVLRGIIYFDQGNFDAALADCTYVIALTDVLPVHMAMALCNRGFIFQKKGEEDAAVHDYTCAIELPGSPPEQIAQALINRGMILEQRGDMEAAISDCTRVIEMPGIGSKRLSQAIFNRGIMYASQADNESAIGDYSHLIELSGADGELIVRALFNRGVAFEDVNDIEAAIADYTRVIEMSDASPEMIARTLLSRGFARSKQGDSVGELADYNRAIELRGVPMVQLAKAIFNRGVRLGESGDSDTAISDYTIVIGMPEARSVEVAKAYINRGFMYGQQGDRSAEIKDYTSAVELAGAPSEQVAWALLNRSYTFSELGDEQKAVADFQRVIELADASAFFVVKAHLGIAENHFISGKWDEGFSSIESAMDIGSQQSPSYFETPVDLIGVLFSAGLSQDGRHEQAAQLHALYARYEALAALGEALVKHVGSLTQAKPRPASDNLDQWLAAWEQAARDASEFRLPLRLLRTGIEYLKSGDDPGVLLSLTATERSLLRQALGLEEAEVE